jgi:hypothetical protein
VVVEEAVAGQEDRVQTPHHHLKLLQLEEMQEVVEVVEELVLTMQVVCSDQEVRKRCLLL